MIKTLKRNFEIKIYTIIMLFFSAVISVSYTHLDVYKRQI